LFGFAAYLYLLQLFDRSLLVIPHT